MAFWHAGPGVETGIKLKKLKEEGCSASISVRVPKNEVDEAMQNALVQIQARASLPGFRPGKAPIHLIRQNFAPQAKQKVIEETIKRVMPQIEKDFEMRPVSLPTVHDFQFEPGKDLTFQLSLEFSPRFEPVGYMNIPLKKGLYTATEQDCQESLKQLQESNARLEISKSSTVCSDNYVVVDYEGFLTGKPVENSKAENELVDMSSPQTIAGLAEGILGARRGETREVPVEYDGRKTTFKIIVKEIKQKVVPPLDDDFGKELGFSSFKELSERVRQTLEKEGQQKTEREITDQIENHLLKNNSIPVPASIVESQSNVIFERFKDQWIKSGRAWLGKEEEKLKEKIRPQGEKEVRLTYIIRAVAQKQGIAATDEDLEGELGRNLEGLKSGKEKEEFRKFFDDHKDEIKYVIRERKVMELIKNNAKWEVA